MSDVAREAGVSLATVSRALNEPHKLTPDTLALVHETIQRMGYVPNLTAGSLASARSRVVGAIVPALSNVWFAQTLDALAQALSTQGYELMLAQSRYSVAEESLLVDSFLARRVEALVLTAGTHDEATVRKLRDMRLPVVELWDWPADPIDMVSGYSNVEVGRCAARHFLSRSWTRIGYIGAQEERAAKRLEGLKQGLRAGGVAMDESAQRLLPPNSGPDAAAAAAAQLLRSHAHLQAIFCSNDVLAAGVLIHARSAGLSVPGQLSVLGFSDMPIAQCTAPALSTIRVEPHAMGESAAGLLLSRLLLCEPGAGASQAQRCDMGFELVLRESA
jgi:LacI family transcriptional regulator, gluconate utilization system Gnt-I transcriptional repressor